MGGGAGFKEHNVADGEDTGHRSPPLLPAAALTVVVFSRVGASSLVYLRVTAEGCGDNGHTLNDALQAPQVDPLHPGA